MGSDSEYVQQRVLACLKLNGGMIIAAEKKPATTRLRALMAHRYAAETVSASLGVLEKKGIVMRQFGGHATSALPGRKKATRGIFCKAVYLVNGDETKVAKWAIDELRAEIESRSLKAKTKKEETPPEGYEARPGWKRELGVAEPEPTAAREASLSNGPPDVPSKSSIEAMHAEGEPDYRQLADALLMQAMETITKPKSDAKEQQSIKKLERKLKEATDYAYKLEQSLKAKQPQVQQLETNLNAVMNAGKAVEAELAAEKRRVRELEGRLKKNQGYPLREHMSPESKEALDKLMRQPPHDKAS